MNNTTITDTKVQKFSTSIKLLSEILDIKKEDVNISIETTYNEGTCELYTDNHLIIFDYVVYAKEETNYIDYQVESVDLIPTYIEVTVTSISNEDGEVELFPSEKKLLEKTIKNLIS